MALATYSDLQSSVASWLARDDLTSVIPDFVVLFEAVANRRLRVRQMETDATLTMTSGAATLPTDYLAWRTVTSDASSGGELEYVQPTWLRAAYPAGESGTAKYFTIEGSTLTVGPSDDTDLTLRYFAKVPALSGTVNWLFTAHPDLYLFGTLTEAKAFIEDEKRALVWKTRRDGIFDEIERLSNKSRIGSIRPVGSIV
jgi:hypothetical protein